MTHEVCRKTMQALTMAEKAVVEPRKISPYSYVGRGQYRELSGSGSRCGWLTVMNVAESSMAFAGISKVGWTWAQKRE